MCRIAIVGPVLPFRSGIAKHTTELAATLAQRPDVDLSMLSFSRQYPAFLYPGGDDRDRATTLPAPLDADYVLDTVNPLSWRRAWRRLLSLAPDKVVIPCWTFFTAPCLGWLARQCQAAGIEVVMIVHNAQDHEAAGWKNRLTRYQLAQASRFLVHGSGVAKDLQHAGLTQPVIIHPHPIFGHYPDASGALPRRAALELLFFGLIRPYKGLDVALEGLARSGRKDAVLTIAGEFWDGQEETEALIERLGLSHQVEMIPRYVSDAEAAELFTRADAVLLPYRAVTGSGVVPVAYRYGKPVIVSDLPGLTEVVTEGKTGWTVPAADADALADLLRDVMTAEAAVSMAPTIAEARAAMSWEELADALVEPSKDQG